MTSHYIDIKVLPDPEFAESQLFSALYAKLHRALVQQGQGSVAVSFPRYSLHPRALGPILRLHGSATALAALMASNWLTGMRDHVQTSAVQPVPPGAQHCTVARRQFKTNAERLRRRRMLRKGESEAQAQAAIPDSAAEKPSLPFIRLRSSSTGQPFHLFIALGRLQPQAVPGTYNAYGLSNTATVPWF